MLCSLDSTLLSLTRKMMIQPRDDASVMLVPGDTVESVLAICSPTVLLIQVSFVQCLIQLVLRTTNGLNNVLKRQG